MQHRKRKVAVLTAILTTIAGLAFAAFVTEFVFEGSGSNSTTKGSTAVLPASVAFNPRLFPGEGKQLNITLNNTTGKVLHARKIEWAVTDSNEPACPASTFFVEGESNEDKELEAGKGGAEIQAGTNSNWTPPEGGYIVRMKDTGKEDQGACEAVTVTVKVKLHASRSRRLGEAIIIEHRIEVVITSVVGGKVRLGIVAPDDVPVFRKEIEQGQPSPSAA